MNKRQKALKLMAEVAGLTALNFDTKSSRVYLTCEAQNGNTASFWLSNTTQIDACAERNEQARMKRFARENAVAGPYQPAEPPLKAPTTMQTNLEKLKQMTTPKTTPNPVLDLSHAEFLRLAMWLNNQPLDGYPSIEALVLECSKHMGRPVEVGSVRSAMQELKKQEPARWSEPTDPHTILVREVGNMLKELGVTPSAAFSKLFARVVP